jgi:hypothetical protein
MRRIWFGRLRNSSSIPVGAKRWAGTAMDYIVTSSRPTERSLDGAISWQPPYPLFRSNRRVPVRAFKLEDSNYGQEGGDLLLDLLHMALSFCLFLGVLLSSFMGIPGEVRRR